jgi:hypothetical protein
MKDSNSDIEASNLSVNAVNHSSTKSKKNEELYLDLLGAVCIDRNGKYTVFARCGNNPKRGWAPWVHYDPIDSGSKPIVSC